MDCWFGLEWEFFLVSLCIKILELNAEENFAHYIFFKIEIYRESKKSKQYDEERNQINPMREG